MAIQAGGALTASKRVRIKLKGRTKVTAGGTLAISANTAVSYLGKIDIRGMSGGSAAITSATGNVLVDRLIDADGLDGPGGTVTIEAPLGDIATGSIDVDGKTDGGEILLDGASGSVIGNLAARGSEGSGGLVNAIFQQDAQVKRVSVRSGEDGGLMNLSTGNDLTVASRLSADGKNGSGGSVQVGVGGSATLDGITAFGGVNGGTVSLQAIFGSMSLEDVEIDGKIGNGGLLQIATLDDLFIDRSVTASGAVNGGDARMHSSAGNVTLGTRSSSEFHADGATGGTIESSAGLDLTARGDFRAANGGCIGLAAGGTLDTSMAIFDGPVTASCP